MIKNQTDIQMNVTKKRFSVSQIYCVLREIENGIAIPELVKKYGICQATIYNWRVQYSEMNRLEKDRLYELEFEYDRLKEMFAEVTLKILKLKDKL
jgi:putative transposase